MMPTSRLTSICACMLLASCSKTPAPEAASQPAAARAVADLPAASEDVVRGNLNVGGTRVEYAAQFDADQLTRITEHRRHDAALYEGKYEFKGARLLHYRGTKLADAAALDLSFDLQGALLSGAGPNVSEDDIRAIRGRAQLLRSHALAHRDGQMHQ